MSSTLARLQKMIALEIEQGYENKAVIGGLERVLDWWPIQARTEYRLPNQRAMIEEIIIAIAGYGTMQTAQERAQAIAEVQEKLAQIETSAQQASESMAETLATMFTPASVPSLEQATPHLADAVPKQSTTPARSDASKDQSRLGLDSPVTVLSGVGPTQARRLKRLGVETIHDLIHLFPRRHDDYSKLKPIGKLAYGEQVTVIGTIHSTKLQRHRGGAAIVNTLIADGSGMLQVTWFNQPYLAEQLKRGRQIVLSGKVDEYLGRKVMTSPTWEPVEAEQTHTGRLVPVYPLTEGLGAKWLRRIMKFTVDYWTKRLPDYLPARIRERLGLLSREQAVAQMHFPDDEQSLAQARRRLAFDEFFLLQLGVLRQRQQWQGQPGVPIQVDPAQLEAFVSGLPYELTGAQRRSLDEILQDVNGNKPMSRLLQGDVGSGKTVVAATAIFVVTTAGYQAAIMAPTEILAEQHMKNLSQLLEKHGIAVRLLTGSVPQSEKEAIYSQIASGQAQVVIGTQAIIQQKVDFARLALAVVDEQHRFGVRQRGILRGKGYNPHILVMSATPIPRTLALTLYGDLDLSVIDEMPPGRQPIQTRWFAPAERGRAYRFIHAQVEEGRQAYIICPLVEESDKIETKAAVEEYQRLKTSIFPDLRLGLLHGRMKGEEKEQTMRQFSARELDILVSTSVVEVGIDVPNATVMLIEGANRFGLSQLHQFRGRVGRGEHQSHCILMADADIEAGFIRLQAIEETQDGFQLAQKDLELRGPGDFFGTQQSGLPQLKLASLGDTPLLELARNEALALFAEDPTLSQPAHRLLASKVAEFWSGEGDLS